jgi:hypothetical protein
MSDDDRAFLTTAIQIIPVLLLAMVIEARLFQFTTADAIPGVKEARKELRASMPAAIYWAWRARAAYRRHGVSTLINFVIVGALAVVEFLGLVTLAYNGEIDDGFRAGMILALAVGIVSVSLKPAFEQIVRQNVQLVELERDVAAGIQSAASEGATKPQLPVRKVRRKRKNSGD